MVSLANSILLQRINKVYSAVNVAILAGLVALVPVSTQANCKSIIEVFSKTCTDAVWQNDHVFLDAVRHL
jgi:phosphatidylinositol 4-kinase